MFFKRYHKEKWDNAYKAAPKFYKRGTETLGVFALTENTDTIIPLNPYAVIDNKEVNNWEILLVPLGNMPPIGSARFENIIRILKQYKNVEQKGKFIYVTGLSRDTMKEIYNKSLLLK